MADSPAQDQALRLLLSRFVDGEMTRAEQAAVAARLRGDRTALRLYIRLVSLDHLLRKQLAPSTSAGPANLDWADILSETGLPADPAIVEPAVRRLAPAQGGAVPHLKEPKKTRRAPWPRVMKSPRLAAAILILATAALWLLFGQRSKDTAPRAASVATITASTGAVWEGAGVSSALDAGRRLNLLSGCVELALVPSAAYVVLEGPARITLVSSTAISLDSGKLAAHVAGGGLVVTTPTAVVTDLGTDFGISVRPDGATDVEVFKGRVQASPIGRVPAAQARILAEGEAASVFAGAVTMDASPAIPQHFVRDLDAPTTTLDVVDIVAGGDGTSHRRGFAIDSIAGDAGALRPRGVAYGDGRYYRVPSLPLIDGTFVPFGRLATEIDSAGHSFAFTARDSATFSQIWAGGSIPWKHPGLGGTVPSRLAGVDYGAPGHGPLFMPANKGLTFDLQAIRRLYPRRTLKCFRSVVGNSFDSATPLPNRHPHADVYVIVDGQVRFQRMKFSNEDGGFPVNVALGDSDRFLTLVTTDGGDPNLFGWVLFGDPAIGLGPQ